MQYILATFVEYEVLRKGTWMREVENSYDEFDDLEECKRHADMMQEHLEQDDTVSGFDIRIYELTNY